MANEAGGFNVKISAQDLASSVVQGVGRSIGTIATEAVLAKQKVAELKALIVENADKPGLLAGLSAELDQELPRLKELEAELRNAGKVGQESFDGVGQATVNWGSGLSQVKSLLGALGIATTVAGVVRLGEAFVENVGKIEDLHEATGITAADLQRLQYVGSGVDLSMDVMGRAVETLATRLAKGDDSAKHAVEALGLSVKDLIAQGPMEAFLSTADAAGRIENPMLKGSIAAELFGDKVAKKLLPMLSDLRAEMAKVPKDALIPDEDIKSIDALADAWAHAKLEMEGYLARKVTGFFKPTRQQNEAMGGTDYANQIAAAGIPDRELPAATGAAVSGVDLLANRLKALRSEALEPLTAEQKKAIVELHTYGESEKDIADLTQSNVRAVHLYLEAVRESTAETKKANAERDREKAAAADAASSMHTLTGEQIEAVKWYQAQGAGVAEIAKALGIYENQVRQVETVEKELAASRKIDAQIAAGPFTLKDDVVARQLAGLNAIRDALKRNYDAEAGLRQQHDALVRQQTMTAYDFQRSQIDAWVNDEEGKLDYSVEGWEAAYNRIHQVAGDRLADIDATHARVLADMRGQVTGYASAWQSSLAAVPGIMQNALTGGGGASGAFQAMGSKFGSELTGAFFNKSGITGLMSKGIMSMGLNSVTVGLAEMTPMIGPLLGSMLGPLVKKIIGHFGPSQEELEGRKVEESFEKSLAQQASAQVRLRAGTNQLAQAEAGLQEQYIKTGMSAEDAARQAQADFEALFAAEKRGAAEVQRVQDEITARMEAQKKIQDAVRADLESLPSDLNNIITGSLDPQMKVWDEVGSKAAAAKKKIDDLAKAGGSDTSGIAEATKDLEAQRAAALAAKDELADLGAIAVSAFSVALASGKSFAEAIAAAGPGLDSLIQAYKDLGITSDDAFLNILMGEEAIAKAQPALMKGVSSLGPALKGMADLGLLNVGSFAQMERQGFRMFTQLQGEAAKTTSDVKTIQTEALIPMQEYLHQAEQAAKDLGEPLDANTQMLIDQSKELGIWKDKGKSSMDIMTDAVKALVDKMSEFLDKLGLIPHDVDVNVHTKYDTTGTPPPDDGGKPMPEQPDPIPMANGGAFEFRKPTLVLAGEAGTEQAVFSGGNKTLANFLRGRADDASTPWWNDIGVKIGGGEVGGGSMTPAPLPPWWNEWGLPRTNPGDPRGPILDGPVYPLPGVPGGGNAAPDPDIKVVSDLLRQLLEALGRTPPPQDVTIKTMLDDRVVAESVVRLAQKNSYGLGDQIRWVAKQGDPA